MSKQAASHGVAEQGRREVHLDCPSRVGRDHFHANPSHPAAPGKVCCPGHTWSASSTSLITLSLGMPLTRAVSSIWFFTRSVRTLYGQGREQGEGAAGLSECCPGTGRAGNVRQQGYKQCERRGRLWVGQHGMRQHNTHW